MALNSKTKQRAQALILQCLFASVATPVGPTVGEVMKFIVKHGSLVISEYQMKLILTSLVSGKFVEAKKKKHGKRDVTHYYITTQGTYLLLGSVSFLPKHIMTSMTDLAFRVSMGAQSLIEAYHAQGVSHG